MRRFGFIACSLIAFLTLPALSEDAKVLPDTPETITSIDQAWVRLYEDQNFGARALTIKHGTEFATLDAAHSDEGKKEFDNQASSARFQIPVGWKVVLYDHHEYDGRTYELKGTGKVVELPKLEGFDDNASSLRWERDAN